MRKQMVLTAVLALVVGCAPPGWSWNGAVQAPANKSASAAKPELLDINSATKEQLMKLPGIGTAYSDKIAKARPFARKDDLVRRKIIPQAAYDGIKGLIVARQK